MTPSSAHEARGLCQEQFDQLLAWLDPDRNEAGKKYELIRARLIRLFRFKGAADSHALADKTIDRVASKLGELNETYCGDPARYFCGVAWKVFWEYRRIQMSPCVPAAEPGACDEHEFASLEACLKKLDPTDRDLVLSFYAAGREEKQKHRRQIAEQLGWAVLSLRTKATRIRSGLMKCVLLKLDWWQRTR